MLGLVSHEPHFTLLREIVDFGGGLNRNENALKAVTKFTTPFCGYDHKPMYQ